VEEGKRVKARSSLSILYTLRCSTFLYLFSIVLVYVHPLGHLLLIGDGEAAMESAALSRV
jgi:hypothetical protein